MKTGFQLPAKVPNWIDGQECGALGGEYFSKLSPHNGKIICHVVRSKEDDVNKAVGAATRAQLDWAAIPAVQRGNILHHICNSLEENIDDVARVVALETSKSNQESLGEVAGAIALGRFFAGEGQRLYGRTTTSGSEYKYASTIRQPCGVAGLIIAANTPIANIAWKVFPALICGNGVVLKAAEDAPATAWLFSKIAHKAGLLAGVLNVIQGIGVEAGAPLVEHEGVDVLSFTGSTAVGRWVAEAAAKRLIKVSLELGGKNALIVCDDCDIDNAVAWCCLSAFSNAGQRCAAGSRFIVFDEIYNEFRDKLVAATVNLRIGPGDDDDLGPVINENQLNNMLTSIAKAKAKGATVLCGGNRLDGPDYVNGFYMAPTLIENASLDDEISTCELFGPIAALYRAKDFDDALLQANASPYGLTAAIHTRNYHRAVLFTQNVKTGVAVVNAGTYGSEPHMPFGGLRQSGNGTREPGTEALDIYSELKDVYMVVDPSQS